MRRLIQKKIIQDMPRGVESPVLLVPHRLEGHVTLKKLNVNSR